MRKTAFIALLLLFLVTPQFGTAQSFAVAGRAGFLGVGGEVALGLSDQIVLRGGYGVFPIDIDGTYNEHDWTLTFPSSVWSASVDLYLGGGPFRIMGGFMGRSGDLELESEWTDSREIGGILYTESGTLNVRLEQKSMMPFAGIGFGKHTDSGIGLFLDIGVAFSGSADLVPSVSGPIEFADQIDQAIQDEADEVEEDLGSYIEYWPIVNLGIKIPLGGGY